MTSRSKQEYAEAIHRRYKGATPATRQEKTLILDEYCATCGCHRNHSRSGETGKVHK